MLKLWLSKEIKEENKGKPFGYIPYIQWQKWLKKDLLVTWPDAFFEYSEE